MKSFLLEVLECDNIIGSLVSEACTLDGRDRKGICFSALGATEPSAINVFCIGDIQNSEDLKRFANSAISKAIRLREGLRVDHHRISGWEDRDDKSEPKRYGGAVCNIHGDIVSVAGLSEYYDESIAAAILRVTDYNSMPNHLLRRIANVSDNPYIIEFVQQWCPNRLVV